jgi:DNA mismatch repair protein MutS
MMDQYLRVKADHPGAIVFFRMGDFYEMFFDDAKKASQLLGLTLTSRGRHHGKPVPMAGVPWHAADGAIHRLVQAGCRVALCDQVEDPRKAKGLVRREVTEIITPGTVLSDGALGARENRYIASVVAGSGLVGVALADLSTGEFLLGEYAPEAAREELQRFRPAEVVLPDGATDRLAEELGTVVTTSRDSWTFTREGGRQELTRHLGTAGLDGFGCEDLNEALGAAGGLLRYLKTLKGEELRHIVGLRRLNPRDVLFLDAASLRHLEVFEAPPGGSSLRDSLDRTATAMGSRFLRQALARPLRHVDAIRARQDAIERLVSQGSLRQELAESLGGCGDLERLGGRLGCGKATPRDLGALRRTLERLPGLRQRLAGEAGRLGALAAGVHDLEETAALLRRALVDEPPAVASDGGIFREGYADRLDALRRTATDGREWIANLQDHERRATGIASLKVGFNRVFGYYIEVTRPNLANVPDRYQRRQTLAGAERFVTEELKEKESVVLGAEERQAELELNLFEELRARVAAVVGPILETARALAELDFLVSLAAVAVESGYTRPEVHDGDEIRVVAGRHPIVEKHLGAGEFIPNDCEIHPERRQILIITGPNMAGKSTYLRQMGLIVLMAQVGAFVPARSASIGVVDRIFTRVGASDNIARGQSTFLVEMNESANILHNATRRSLVLLDEVGRGTSTFDGLSIAWAIVEHLHDGMSERPRTLFATHFHELTRLAERLRRVANCRVEVREWGGQVVFLRKIVDGKADRSYGIHVAEMAGLPKRVIDRAREILAELERGGGGAGGPAPRAVQTSLALTAPEPSDLERALGETDLDRMAPIDALTMLHELKSRLKLPPAPRGS